MDFNINRGGSQQPAPQNTNRPVGDNVATGSSAKKNLTGKKSSLIKAGSFVLLLLITFLVAAVLVVLSTGSNSASDKESGLVKTNQLQAVFLTNGQVYFGNIQDVNSKYINLSNIYYLTTNQTVQSTGTTAQNTNANSGVQLVKLGCELHAPLDQMTINRDQVTFWENLKDDGQVGKAVAQYKQQNPNGQNCSTNASQTTSTGTGTTNQSTTTNQ